MTAPKLTPENAHKSGERVRNTYKLTPAQVWALLWLAEVADMPEFWRVPFGNPSLNTLKALVKRGLAEKNYGDAFRLTPAGLALAKEVG